MTHSFRRRLGAAAALLLPLVVYVYCLCPTIAVGDTTELINCAAILGIPHAPGYPLFTMLGHLFTWLPLNSVAWRVNLSSAVFCALACLFVYLSLLRLTGRVWAALAGAWGLAFSRFFWHYAEVAEVFPLNNLFVALVTYVLVLLRDSLKAHDLRPRTRRVFWLFCLLYGLALTNHHTFILLAPGALFFLWFSAPELFRDAKTLGVGVLLFFVGLLPYVYCPLVAMTDPLLNWGNPVTLKNFIRLILRMDFGTLSLSSAKAAGPRVLQLPPFFGSFYHQFTPLGIGLALLGLLGIKRHKVFQAYLGLGFLFSGLFFVVLANYPLEDPLRFGVLHRFYIMPAVLFSFWIGLGVDYLMTRTEEKGLCPAACLSIPVCLTVGLLTWQFLTNIRDANFRGNFMAEDFAYNLLLCLPKDSLFFVRGDAASMGMNYFQMVLGQRNDIMTLDQEKLTYSWYYEQVKRRFPSVVLRGERYDGVNTLNLHLIADNMHHEAVCFRNFKEDSYEKAFQALPMGLVRIMVPKHQAFPVEKLEGHVNRFYANFKKRGWQRDFPLTSIEHTIKTFYAEPLALLAHEFHKAGKLEKAAQYYRMALDIDPNQLPSLKNLAMLYLKKMKRPQEAVDLLARYIEVNPDDKDAERIRQIIKMHKR